jgi:hypothetical protein
MKSLIVVAALGLGAGAVAVTLTIQANRFAFTSLDHRAPVTTQAALVRPPTFEAPAALTLDAPTRTVRLPVVNVVGRMGPPRAVATRTAAATVRVRAATPAPVVHEPPPPEDRVIPAPCIDGEYRKLEENRGVRLMCPGHE